MTTYGPRRLTERQHAALVYLAAPNALPLRYSNVTSFEHRTLYWQTFDGLYIRDLIAPAPLDRRLELRDPSDRFAEITAAGRAALDPRFVTADELGRPLTATELAECSHPPRLVFGDPKNPRRSRCRRCDARVTSPT